MFVEEANEFVLVWHRHHKPVLRAIFAVAVADETDTVRGVAIVGRPSARELQDGYTAEVRRLATDGAKNACSMLYAACWRGARAIGYRRLVTYILESEPGTSLRAAGWREGGPHDGSELGCAWPAAGGLASDVDDRRGPRTVGSAVSLTLVTCPCGCGKEFSPVGSRGRTRTYFSPGCSLRVNRQQCDWNGRKHSDETRAKISAAARGRPNPNLRGERNGMYGRTGAANPNFVDGSSPERQRAYASAQWRATVRVVRKRDGDICGRCGAVKAGPRSIHRHHKKPWAGNPTLRFDPDNIETLCRDCHITEHSKGGDAHE